MTTATEAEFKSGVVAIAGAPNVGKSTLLNRLLGQKIAIVTPRPQTTRNRILGILNGPAHQILLLDTPGLHRPQQELNQAMVRIARQSLADADVVLFLLDGAWQGEGELRQQQLLEEHLGDSVCPLLLGLNKVDLLGTEVQGEVCRRWQTRYPAATLLPLSALQGEGVEQLVTELTRLLPVGPRYYPEDIPTDASERFIVAELIREQVFLQTRDEVPYATAVLIDSFQEGSPIVRIHATILVERDSQKAILIGRGGSMLREIGSAARREIEQLLACRVHLELWIKVRKNWSRDGRFLTQLGF
ncbi:MAG: GTPase Era [Desulfobulbaceae bacterium A2]|nr:MAG: GTPase Era [Desulfobulbaceae bacterium A2]